MWHPNTQMREWDTFDEIVSANGMYLHARDGTRMLDGVASMWCNVWGHSRPELVDAITMQARALQHTSLFNLTHGPAEELARMLVNICPGMQRVFYSDNGSSAMEISLKMALHYWTNLGERRSRFASLRGGYHGDTFGSMSIGYSSEFFSRYRKSLFRCRQLPVPYRYRTPTKLSFEEYQSRCLERIEDTLASDDSIAAFVMESGAQVAGGAIVYPQGFQSGVARICKKHGVLFILDEVATGLGRLGSMAEYTVQGGRPDIVAFGKMLTGGYLTLAATLTTKKIYDAFLGEFGEGRHLFHGHTYTGNPIAAAVAVENLRMYRRHNLMAHVKRVGQVLGESCSRFEKHDAVGDVRHKGMLMGIEMVRNKNSKKPLSAVGSLNRTIFKIAKRNGVYLRTLGSVVLLVPPLAISETDLGDLVERTAITVREVGEKLL